MTNYKELVKERTSIPGYVEEVERFSTWWSNNIATVITYYDSRYWVFLLVYDPVYSTYRPAVFPESYNCSYWGDSSRGRKGHYNSYDAKSEASWLRGELAYYGKYYDNPILLIHPYCDCSRSFGDLVKEPYVTKNYSTSYLKPLDVVKSNMTAFYHVGVYLGKIDGKDKVCHFTKKNNDTTIDQWSDFAKSESGVISGGVFGEGVIACHPIIPFKNYKDIARQVVWAKDNHFRRGNYNERNRNCEHFANMVVYGINFSEQIEQREWAFGAVCAPGGAAITATTGLGIWSTITYIGLAPFTGGVSLVGAAASIGATVAADAAIVGACMESSETNNGKTSINLRGEMERIDNLLGKKYDCETKKYEEQYLIEIPPRENCRIM